MSFKKTMLTIAAVGAVTAGTAVPAMALENEFHGLYRMRAFISNFDDSGSGPQAIGAQAGSHTVDAKAYKNPPTYGYLEQRARLMYSAKANDDLKLVTFFEFDSRFGDNSYNSNGQTRNAGGGIGADQTNLETKNIFLDFRIPSTPVRMKVGVQGFTDNYKGIIFNNDAAGVTAAAKVGNNATVQAAFFRFDDASGTGTTTNAYFGATTPTATSSNSQANVGGGGTATAPPVGTAAVAAGDNRVVGHNTRDFYNLGGKYSISKNLAVGADYYLLYSDVMRNIAEDTFIHYFGANAEGKVGPVTINGFLLAQTGKLGVAGPTGPSHQSVNAFAGNVAAKMQLGPGTARMTALWVSGDGTTALSSDRHDFQTIMERGATTSGHTFYESNAQLLFRNVYATDKTDRAVVFDLNNNGRGVITGWLGYDLPIGKFFANSNVGIAACAADNGNYRNGGIGSGNSNVLGTEVNTEVGYKLYDNMTASVQAAYLFLGDFYNVAAAGGTGKPDNPYTAKVMLNYTF